MSNANSQMEIEGVVGGGEDGAAALKTAARNFSWGFHTCDGA